MATIPTIAAWSAGEKATAAKMNAQIRDPVTLLLDPPHAWARQTTAQSIPNGALTSITFQTEVEDNDVMFTPGENKMTIKTPGRYSVAGMVSFASNTTGIRLISITVGSTEVERVTANPAVGSFPTRISFSPILRFALNDTVFLNAYQTSTAALNTAVGSTFDQSTLHLTWLGK